MYTTPSQMECVQTDNMLGRQKWTRDEISTFFEHLPVYKMHFYKYKKYLNRSYSQIKGYYYSQQKKGLTGIQVVDRTLIPQLLDQLSLTFILGTDL